MTPEHLQKKHGLDPDKAELAAEWIAQLPPMIARKQVEWFLGGIISRSALATADSSGTGPAGALRLGSAIMYPTPLLIVWLVQRTSVTRLRNASHLIRGKERPAPGHPAPGADLPPGVFRPAQGGRI